MGLGNPSSHGPYTVQQRILSLVLVVHNGAVPLAKKLHGHLNRLISTF
jgi:hypothetical protein